MTKTNLTKLSCLLFSLHIPSIFAQQVEVTLVDHLDGNLNGYCIDIAGGNRNIDINKGLQTHTCYSYRGDLGKDQVFDSEQFAKHALYMPNYNVCASLTSLEVGSKVNLAECNGSRLQSITFTKAGKLRPTGLPELCLTAGKETRFGRGGSSPHQIKDLTLEKCSTENAAYQTWRYRTYDDDPA